jgi:hypothetical protein
MPDTSASETASLKVMAVDLLTTEASGLMVNVESPLQGTATNAPSIFLSGWIVKRNGRVRRVSIQTAERRRICPRFARPDLAGVFGEQASKRAGFFCDIWAFNIAATEEVYLVAAVDGEREIVFARLLIHASSRALPKLAAFPESSPDPLPGLLIVNSLGRSGTTLLMERLLRHPKIGGYAVPPYESRFILRAALHSRFSMSSTRAHYSRRNQWYAHSFGAFDWVEDETSEGERRQILIQTELSRLMAVVSRYQVLLEKELGRQISFICEKSVSADDDGFLFWIWPKCKSVIMVRDLRDVLCSYIAFDRKRENPQFTKGLDSNPETYFTNLATYAANLARIKKRRPEDTLVVRYEDLVLHPINCMRQIFESCELDCDDPTLRNVCFIGLPGDADQFGTHGTSYTPESSVGRWQRDLSEEMFGYYEKYLEGINIDFGYKS